MAISNLLRRINLGNEFDIGNLVANRVKLKIGDGLGRLLDGTIVVIANPVTIYEYSDNWAEEAGAISNNNNQWSWGNGDTGNLGLPFGDGWEIYETYIQADSGGANGASLTIDVVDRATNDAGNQFHTIEIIDAGDGQVNNAWVLHDHRAAPIAVPDGAVMGFRTNTEVGTWASARVGIRARRSIGVVQGTP